MIATQNATVDHYLVDEIIWLMATPSPPASLFIGSSHTLRRLNAAQALHKAGLEIFF